ncbi:MAG: MFS transporter, partial [Microbacteriaceae bacterium]|nr:MFS transporter [Microbacteriaceae bacterium]
VVMLALSPVAARLVRRIGPELLLALASALLVSALIAAAFAPRAVPTMIVVMIVFGIGLAFGFASTPIIIMTSVPREQTAAANAVNQLSRSIGSTVAAAVVGAVLAASSTSLGGQPVPSTGGFTVSFLLAAVACAATVVIALCIPRRRGLYIAGQEG